MISQALRVRRSTTLSLVVVAITLVAFGLRSFHVARLGLTGDEALGAALAYRGLDATVAATTSGDPHPPLYYVLLKGWIALAGDGELALRFLGLAAGILLVPLTYKLGRWLFSEPGPLVAALWLAVHPYQVWYAHEARMYLPIALFATLSTALLVRWLRRQAADVLAVYAIATVLALYTHYYAVFLVIFQNVFVLGLWALGKMRLGKTGAPTARLHQRPADVRIAQWVLGQLALFAGYLPWLIVARDLVGSYNALGWIGPLAVLKETLVRFSVGHTWEWPGNVAVGAGFALLAAIGVVAALQGSAAAVDQATETKTTGAPTAPQGWEGWLLLGWALFPATAGLVGSFTRPMLVPRYLMVSAAAFALALGLGLATLWRWRWPLGALALIGVLSVSGRALHNLYFDPTYARSGYNHLARYLVDHGQPGDAVIVAGWTQKDTFWYYYQHRLGGQLPVTVLPTSDPLDPARTMADVEEVMAKHQGVWYVETDTARYDPQRIMERRLATHHYKVLDKWFHVNRLVYYASAAQGPDMPRQTIARFGDHVSLVGVSLNRTAVRPGEAALVGLLWETSRQLSANYKVSVLLNDPAGHVLSAVDREPSDGFARTSGWEPGRAVRDLCGIVVPTTALPGEYAVVVKLYDLATGQALPATDATGKKAPDGVVVSRLTIAGPPVPSVRDAGPTKPVGVELGPVRLVGYDAPPDVQFLPGQPVGLRLYWLLTAPLGDARLRFDLIDQHGRPIAGTETPIAPTWCPTSLWETGRTLGAYAEFIVPPRTPTGRHRLRLATVGGSGETASERTADLGSIRVLAPARSFSSPTPEHAIGARFGGLAQLAGYDGPATGTAVLRPGESLRFVLHWQAIGESDVSFKVFTHLVGPGGRLYGQRDAPPEGGQRPTTGWVRGEVLADPYEVPLAHDAPGGTYVLRVGLYEEASGKRLPLADSSGDSLDVLAFQVVGR